MDAPLVSVLMPVFNGQKFLETAIESILSQTFRDFELIIIDDGSTDESWKILKKYAQADTRVKSWQNQQNLGICQSLNRGIELIQGQYIARMDADDWSYPERLSLQVEFMKAHPKVVISGADIEVCDENLQVLNKRVYPKNDRQIREKIFRLNPFAHPAVIYQTEAVRKIKGYNLELALVEDYDLYFRLGKLGQFANLKETILKLRTHPNSVSQKNIARQAKLNLEVRRKAVLDYGYRMKTPDKLYFFLSQIGVKLIPAKLKFSLYNLFRRIYE